jgi:hypothetical protein
MHLKMFTAGLELSGTGTSGVSNSDMAQNGACEAAGGVACMRPVGPVYCGSFLRRAEGVMDSTSQSAKWTPYEAKAASITYERRSEDLQLEQLRIRLQKKMREAEGLASTPTAA